MSYENTHFFCGHQDCMKSYECPEGMSSNAALDDHLMRTHYMEVGRTNGTNSVEAEQRRKSRV